MKQTLNQIGHRWAAAAFACLLCGSAFAEEAEKAAAKPTGVLGSLGLDPRTVFVQALAFILLLWALKKFLWKPILTIIAERQTEIADTYAAAEEAQAKALAAQTDYEARLAQADEESRKRIAEALTQASAMKDEIIASARQQADRIVASGHENVRQEMEKAQVQIRESATKMAVDLAGRIIQQNITPESQRSLIDRFIEGAGQPQ